MVSTRLLISSSCFLSMKEKEAREGNCGDLFAKHGSAVTHSAFHHDPSWMSPVPGKLGGSLWAQGCPAPSGAPAWSCTVTSGGRSPDIHKTPPASLGKQGWWPRMASSLCTQQVPEPAASGQGSGAEQGCSPGAWHKQWSPAPLLQAQRGTGTCHHSHHSSLSGSRWGQGLESTFLGQAGFLSP